MGTPRDTVIALANPFWQSLVDHDTHTALTMLSEPSLMVSPHGTMQFDHASFRKMAEKDSMTLSEFELSEMRVVFPNDNTAVVTYHASQKMSPRGTSDGEVQEMNDSSVWVKEKDGWKCVMHTESPTGNGRTN